MVVMVTPLQLKVTEVDTNTFYVPESYFKLWLQRRNFPTQISFGAVTISCRIAPHPDKKNEYLITKDCSESLCLPYEGSVHVFEHENTLHIGPLIGIFTAGFQSSTLRPIGERSIFFAKLLSAEQKIGAYYFVFGAHHIDWSAARINGYFYTKKGWIQSSVPFPNVIYNRLPNRKVEQIDSFQQIKNKLENEYLIPWFNPSFFDKWEIHEKLISDGNINQFLPSSILNPSLEQINELLDTHQHLYIKPAKGSLGYGIHQIIKLKNDPYYYCRFRTKDQNRLRRYSTLQRLIKQQFPTGYDDMIFQQGVNLIKIKNNPVDFRVHTNKNEYGRWQVSAMAAKVAGLGSVTTHIKSGGEIKTVAETIEEAGLTRAHLEKLKTTALLLSKKIDENIDGFIGEIGFDLGIDNQGKVWMFEANSKPGRTIFSNTKLRNDDMMSRRLPLAYAVYLAKQMITKPELHFS